MYFGLFTCHFLTCLKIKFDFYIIESEAKMYWIVIQYSYPINKVDTEVEESRESSREGRVLVFHGSNLFDPGNAHGPLSITRSNP